MENREGSEPPPENQKLNRLRQLMDKFMKGINSPPDPTQGMPRPYKGLYEVSRSDISKDKEKTPTAESPEMANYRITGKLDQTPVLMEVDRHSLPHTSSTNPTVREADRIIQQSRKNSR